MEHDRAYHRFKSKVKRNRRINIIRNLWDKTSWEWVKSNPKRLGQLVKGKVHCSCPDCSAKTNKHGWKKNDYARIMAMSNEVMEEYGNAYKKLSQGVKKY